MQDDSRGKPSYDIKKIFNGKKKNKDCRKENAKIVLIFKNTKLYQFGNLPVVKLLRGSTILPFISINCLGGEQFLFLCVTIEQETAKFMLFLRLTN